MNNPFVNTSNVNAVIRIRRGPTSEIEQNTFEDGELIYSTDKKRLFVGDGQNGTIGGILVGNKIWYVDSFDKLPYIQHNDIVYRTDKNALYIFNGSRYLNEVDYTLIGGVKLVSDNLVTQSQYILPDATVNVKGGIFVGDGLSTLRGKLSIKYDTNTLDIVNGKLTVIGGGNSSSNSSLASYSNHGIVKINENQGIVVDGGVVGLNVDDDTIKISSALEGGKLYVNLDKFDKFILKDGPTTLSTNTLTISSGFDITTNGTLNLQPASNTEIGGVIIGNSLSIIDEKLEMPSASFTQKGGITLGEGLSVNGFTGKVDVIASTDSFSLTQNGYQKLPSGLIMQWGVSTSIGQDSSATVTFPIPFITLACSVVVTQNAGLMDGSNGTVSVSDVSVNSFVIRNGADNSGPFYWQAFGF